MRKPQFDCNILSIVLILVGVLFIILNMSIKSWMIFIGSCFICAGIVFIK